ncbi:MAG: MmgE/PrpD family protein [Dehalococcoidales bacterium]|nr:MmgE/PrpD family protein [Dehalococcoidales bacterium]
MEATAIERLVTNALKTRFENIDEDTLEAAKYRIIDTLGCLIGGALDTGNPELLRLLKERGGKKEATVLVYGDKLPVGEAAFMNCIMARSFDFEPVSPLYEGMSCPGHISGTTIPSALTLAEMVGAGGKEMITALLVGDDIATRILAASGFGFTLGWDGVGTVNTFGVVAIAGRLLGLDKLQLRNAFGIALNQIGTTFQSFWDGTTAFKLPQGLAARAGIFSAQLTKAGWTGPKDALFGRFGYYKMFTEGCEKPQALTDNLAKKFYYDGTIKPYPCCRIPHAAIQCALDLIKKHNIKPDDIASVNLDLAQGGIDHVCGHPFKIGAFPHGNAAFSYEYVTATAFLFGSVRPEHFTESAIRNPQVAEFIKKIKLTAVEDVEFEKARMTVTLKDGRRLTQTCTKVKGDPQSNPMTRDEIIDKFWMNVEFSKKISQKKATQLLDILLNLEKVDSVRKIIPLLVA